MARTRHDAIPADEMSVQREFPNQVKRRARPGGKKRYRGIKVYQGV